MRAVQLVDYGSADNFRLVDVPMPAPGKDDLLIKVHYAGLRWGDIMSRQGIPVRATAPPFIPGQEAAGIVVETGRGVTSFKVGDRVTALPPNGAYAEYLCISSNARVAKIPEGVPLASALVYRLNMPTVYFLIYEWAKVQAGEVVLVHAAAGGIGMLAVQVLKRRFENVTVIGLASTEKKCESILANGADYAINSQAVDYVAEVARLVGDKRRAFESGASGGVHVVLNGVGGRTLHMDRRVIRPFGRWVLFGTPSGAEPVNVFQNVYDSISILPFSLIPFRDTPARTKADEFTDAWMTSEALLSPTVRDLEDVASAQRAMERRETHGKIVFAVSTGA